MSGAEKRKQRRRSAVDASGFRELAPPTDLSAERVEISHTYAKRKDTPKGRFVESYMYETHLGGRLEKVPGFDSRAAMTHGFKGRLVLPRGKTAKSHPTLAEGASLAPTGPWIPESRFNEDHAWVRIPNTSLVPWRCICHLEIRYSSGRTAVGTGWLSGSDTVITAGHNVYSAEGDGWATGIRVVPGRDSVFAPFDETYARRIDALSGWVSSNGQARELDLGVIKTADTSVGLRTGWFGFAVFTDQDLMNSPLIHSAGYPAETVPFATQWFDAGRATDFTREFLAYRLDTERGQSGSPIFFKNTAGQRWVIATHVYGESNANLGLRITEPILEMLVAWGR